MTKDLTEIVHAWIRDDLDTGAKMLIGFHANKLVKRFDAALAQPSPLDTSGRVDGSSVAASAGAGPDGPGACDAQCQSEGGAS